MITLDVLNKAIRTIQKENKGKQIVLFVTREFYKLMKSQIVTLQTIYQMDEYKNYLGAKIIICSGEDVAEHGFAIGVENPNYQYDEKWNGES